MVFQIKVFTQARQANTFSTLTAVHETLANDDRIAVRRYILSDFRPHLNSAAADVLGSSYVVDRGEDRVDVPRVLRGVGRDQDKLHQFTRALSAQTTGLPLVGAMDAVERVLNDFDLLAIPVFLGIDHTEKAATAYRAPLVPWSCLRRYGTAAWA